MFCLEAAEPQQGYDELVPLPIIFSNTSLKLESLLYNVGREGKKLQKLYSYAAHNTDV